MGQSFVVSLISVFCYFVVIPRVRPAGQVEVCNDRRGSGTSLLEELPVSKIVVWRSGCGGLKFLVGSEHFSVTECVDCWPFFAQIDFFNCKIVVAVSGSLRAINYVIRKVVVAENDVTWFGARRQHTCPEHGCTCLSAFWRCYLDIVFRFS